jgi:hypothetical protein
MQKRTPSRCIFVVRMTGFAHLTARPARQLPIADFAIMLIVPQIP